MGALAFRSKAATDASDEVNSPPSHRPCDTCDGAILCLGTVCGKRAPPGDNDEMEGEKELGTIGESNDKLSNEIDGDGAGI